MENSDLGESSCRRKLDDKMSGSGRPLKKAKYAWQVKGYRVPDHYSNIRQAQSDTREKKPPDDSSRVPVISDIISDIEIIDESELCAKTEENLEILGDYLLKQQDLDPLQASSDKPEDKPADTKMSSKLQNNFSDNPFKTPSSTPKTRTRAATFDAFDDEAVAPKFTKPHSGNKVSTSRHDNKTLQQIQDQFLARWQARQIAKGFVDNTINRVLDSWLATPLLPRAYNDGSNMAIDMAEFLGNLPANNEVENEGILMAISAHGLQNNQSAFRSDESRLNRVYTVRLSDSNSQSANRRSSTNSETSHLNAAKAESDTPRRHTYSCSSSSQNGKNTVDLGTYYHEDFCPADFPVLNNLTLPCSCSHPTNRSAPVRNVPFHRRGLDDRELNDLDRSMLLPDYTINQAVHTDSPKKHTIEEPKNAESSDDTSSEESSDEDEAESNNGSSCPIPTDNNQPYDEHFDFMDAAVSYAIQTKGLATFSEDYD